MLWKINLTKGGLIRYPNAQNRADASVYTECVDALLQENLKT